MNWGKLRAFDPLDQRGVTIYCTATQAENADMALESHHLVVRSEAMYAAGFRVRLRQFGKCS